MSVVVFKDIETYSPKATPSGTEKIPVSDTEYITPNDILALSSITGLVLVDVLESGFFIVDENLYIGLQVV